MKLSYRLVPAFIAALCAFTPPAHASTEIDWVNEWKDIDTDDHSLKQVITNAINSCGTPDRAPSLIKVYTDNLTHGANPNAIIWGAAYFQDLPQKATCSVQICTAAGGCVIDLYQPPIITTKTYKTSGGKTATKQAYTYRLMWEDRVFSWATITPAAFAGVRGSILDANNKPMYMEPLSDRMVFKAVMRNSACVLEEVDHNHDGKQDSACVKYYQYRDDRFTDLYTPNPYDGEAEDDTRNTSDLFNRSSALLKIEEEGQSWRKDGVKLTPSSTQAVQLPSFHTDSDPSKMAMDYICSQTTSTAQTKSYFVPTNSDREFQSFRTAVANNGVASLSIKDCERRYTEWQGQTVCPAMSCGQSMTITAERHCQRSSSSYGKCDECADLADPNPITGMVTKCFAQQVCSAPPCDGGNGGGNNGSDCVPAEAKVLMADGSTKNIIDVKIGDEVMTFNRNAPLAALHKAKVKELITENKVMIVINGSGITPDHLVLMAGGNRVPAGHLKVGMKMIGISGEPVAITKIEKKEGETLVYNLNIEGGDGIVVDGLRIMAAPKDVDVPAKK